MSRELYLNQNDPPYWTAVSSELYLNQNDPPYWTAVSSVEQTLEIKL
jgi:hypothetical protein